MAHAVIINTETGKIVKDLDAAYLLKDVRLAPNELLSWEDRFRPANSDSNWKDNLMHYKSSVARVQCTRDCGTTINSVYVRIESTNPAQLCELIEGIARLRERNMECAPIGSRWGGFVAWAKAFIQTI